MTSTEHKSLSNILGDHEKKGAKEKESQRLVQLILNNEPTLLNDIQECLALVFKDNKIDANDVPHLVSVLKKICVFMKDEKGSNMPDLCCDILNHVVKLLINNDMLDISLDKKSVCIDELEKLVHSCFKLIGGFEVEKIVPVLEELVQPQVQILKKKKRCLFRFFKKKKNKTVFKR